MPTLTPEPRRYPLAVVGPIVDHREFVSAIAAQIDRLVIRGHELADRYDAKPAPVANLTVFPQLLNIFAIVLLQQPLTRDEISRVLSYTPPALVNGLIDNNIAEGIVSAPDGQLDLTSEGRAAAAGTVLVQEAAVAELWSAATEQMRAVERILVPVVSTAATLEPPRNPSAFGLFSGVCDRPTEAGRTLRLITAVRYWRADAHARALMDADLRPFEAHAMNCLWDRHRGLDRVGQGFPEPGRKGVASLEERGLANGATITADGVAMRERIEQETDRFTAPVYATLDGAAREELLSALSALPG